MIVQLKADGKSGVNKIIVGEKDGRTMIAVVSSDSTKALCYEVDFDSCGLREIDVLADKIFNLDFSLSLGLFRELLVPKGTRRDPRSKDLVSQEEKKEKKINQKKEKNDEAFLTETDAMPNACADDGTDGKTDGQTDGGVASDACDAEASRVSIPGKETKRDTLVKEIFDYWKELLCHPRAKLDNNRRAKINARFAEGFSAEDLKLAILGITQSAYHMGDNPTGTLYNGIQVVFRNAERTEFFMGLGQRAQEKQHKQRPKTQACPMCSPQDGFVCKLHRGKKV